MITYIIWIFLIVRVEASLFLCVSSFKVKVGPHIIEILCVAQIKETEVNSQVIFLGLTFSFFFFFLTSRTFYFRTFELDILSLFFFHEHDVFPFIYTLFNFYKQCFIISSVQLFMHFVTFISKYFTYVDVAVTFQANFWNSMKMEMIHIPLVHWKGQMLYRVSAYK